jgi:hypothetical protein
MLSGIPEIHGEGINERSETYSMYLIESDVNNGCIHTR